MINHIPNRKRVQQSQRPQADHSCQLERTTKLILVTIYCRIIRVRAECELFDNLRLFLTCQWTPTIGWQFFPCLLRTPSFFPLRPVSSLMASCSRWWHSLANNARSRKHDCRKWGRMYARSSSRRRVPLRATRFTPVHDCSTKRTL